MDTPIANHSKADKPQEACGITAIFSKRGEAVSHLLVPMQDCLQHRGRDAAGIAAFNKDTKKIYVYKDLGRVLEVFPKGFDFKKHGIVADAAIGHNRYGTSGNNKKDGIEGAQPLLLKWKGRSVAISYNGNLPESQRKILQRNIPKELRSGPNYDTWDIARAIVSAPGNAWEERIRNALKDLRLAYALTILTDKGEVFGVVCPTETWPLWVGENKDSIVFASETSVVQDKKMVWKKVERGELVKATPHGTVRMQLFPKSRLFRCALHDQYGASGESKMTDVITYGAFRNHLGRLLAREYPIRVNLYSGIPRNSLPIALGFVEELGEKLTDIFTLINKDRSFIARNSDEINAVISGKYAILHPEEIKGKSVLLIDDSLIRGKTASGDVLHGVKGVIALVREAGAKEVHFAVTLPKFTKDCDMGYYIRKESLVALVKRPDGTFEELSVKEIAKRIGADSLSYLSLQGIEEAYQWALGEKHVACMSCMGQKHPLDIISEQSMPQMQSQSGMRVYQPLNTIRR